MLTRLLLLLCLTEHVFAKESPDVDCLVLNLKYVHCYWNKNGTPGVNYTFYSRFHFEAISECTTYLSENGTNIGCNRPYKDGANRFHTFYTTLVHGEDRFQKEHELKQKVKLDPPTNVTFQMESDSNLWSYWNQTSTPLKCVESELRYRINKKKWDVTRLSGGKQNYCINFPSSTSLYELQVRSKIEKSCGESLFWSEWSEPVYWGSNNSTDTKQKESSISVWTPLMYVFGTLILILLVIMLLHHERLRIILIPVVPKPSPIFHDIQDWPQLSKGLKESSKANYNELACPVREYCQVFQSDSESYDSSTSSVTTDQTDCSISMPVDGSDLPASCSSSTSTVDVSSEEKVSV